MPPLPFLNTDESASAETLKMHDFQQRPFTFCPSGCSVPEPGFFHRIACTVSKLIPDKHKNGQKGVIQDQG